MRGGIVIDVFKPRTSAASALVRIFLGVAMVLIFVAAPALVRAACVSDADGDSICDGVDPCPDDGLDDVDRDHKCVGARFNAPSTGARDNCPADANASQADADADGRGDACDLCPSAAGAAEDVCLTTGFWSTRPSNAVERHEGCMVNVGALNFLIGGEQSLAKTTETYDPSTGVWTASVPLPAKRHHFQPVVVKGKVYVIGGLTAFPGPSVNTVWMLDPAHPELGWQTRAPLPTSRGAMGCAADGVRIYCAGGLSSTAANTAINVVEVYNTVTNQWATLAPMPRKRDHFQAAIIDGKFYAISGRDTAITATFNFTDVYDIATNTWSQAAPLPTARGGYALAVMQKRILVIGGEGGGPSHGTFPNVEEYDPRRNLWRTLTSIPTPRHGTGAAVSKAEDGVAERAYVASGGPRQGGSKSAVHEVFAYHSSELVCFAPGSSATFAGTMTADARFTEGADADVLLDNLSSPLLFANSTTSAGSIGSDKATYTFGVARPGNWYLWGRFYYPGAPGSTDANSFFAKIDNGASHVFGNNKGLFRKWHWDGKGSTETGPPDALLLGPLTAGTHTIVIAKREVNPIPPRLDLVCLSQSASPPTDDVACDSWGGCVPLSSTTTLDTVTTTTTTTTLPAPGRVCVAAGGTSPAGSFSGSMTVGTLYAGGSDGDPARNSLTTPLVFPNSTTNSSGENNDKVVYDVVLPATGTWFLWGRFYFAEAPGSNGANSFFAKVDSGSLKKFGNNKDYFRRWHWGGEGALETGTPVAISLGTLAAGLHKLTIEKREVVAIPPRLDVLCVTRDGVAPPTDAQACSSLGGCQ